MRKFIMCFCFFLPAFQTTFAQSCGTKIPAGFYEEVINKEAAKKSIGEEISYNKIPNVNISITVYSYDGAYNINKMQPSVDALNEAFAPAGISFTVCKAESYTEGRFTSITNKEIEKEMTDRYHSTNTINLYLVLELESDGAPVCGYAYLPHDPPVDFIFVSTDSDCEIAATLIHEMGHFFGLLHPHENKYGAELVDGSNCESTGDLICDTEASPNLLGLVSNDCEYIGSYQDSNDDYYLPTVSNFMSYSKRECRCRFTQGQYNRMIDFYWSHMQHLR